MAAHNLYEPRQIPPSLQLTGAQFYIETIMLLQLRDIITVAQYPITPYASFMITSRDPGNAVFLVVITTENVPPFQAASHEVVATAGNG